MNASERSADIVKEIEGYLGRHHAAEAERTLMARALTEITSLRERGDSPLVVRNAELALENRRLREENKWLRIFDSIRATLPVEKPS